MFLILQSNVLDFILDKYREPCKTHFLYRTISSKKLTKIHKTSIFYNLEFRTELKTGIFKNHLGYIQSCNQSQRNQVGIRKFSYREIYPPQYNFFVTILSTQVSPYSRYHKNKKEVFNITGTEPAAQYLQQIQHF